jgi:hypothetical protein
MFEVGDEVVVVKKGYYKNETAIVQHTLHRRGVVKRQAVDDAFNPIGNPYYEEYDEAWVLLDLPTPSKVDACWVRAEELQRVEESW